MPSDLFFCPDSCSNSQLINPKQPQVPLDVSICLKSDAGAPVVASDASSPCAQAYVQIARRLQEKLQMGAAAPGQSSEGSVPRIVVER